MKPPITQGEIYSRGEGGAGSPHLECDGSAPAARVAGAAAPRRSKMQTVDELPAPFDSLPCRAGAVLSPDLAPPNLVISPVLNSPGPVTLCHFVLLWGSRV